MIPSGVAEQTKKSVADYPNYGVDVMLCAFSAKEMREAKTVFDSAI